MCSCIFSFHPSPVVSSSFESTGTFTSAYGPKLQNLMYMVGFDGAQSGQFACICVEWSLTFTIPLICYACAARERANSRLCVCLHSNHMTCVGHCFWIVHKEQDGVTLFVRMAHYTTLIACTVVRAPFFCHDLMKYIISNPLPLLCVFVPLNWFTHSFLITH